MNIYLLFQTTITVVHLQALGSLKLKPSQSPSPDILHLSLSLLTAVASFALRDAQPDDQFVREKTFFAAITSAEKSLSALTWASTHPASRIRIFPIISGSLSSVLSLLQLRCSDAAIALLPPSAEAAAQAKAQLAAYRLLHSSCVEGLQGVSQSVQDSGDDLSLLKADFKSGIGQEEDEGLALAMSCAYYAAVASAAALKMRVDGDDARQQRDRGGGGADGGADGDGDGDSGGDEYSGGGDNISFDDDYGDHEDGDLMSNISPVVRM
jgi:hypothetical protein